MRPLGPSRGVCPSLLSVRVQFGFVGFIWQVEEASLCDLCAVVGGVTLPRRRRPPMGAHPSRVWRALEGPQLALECPVPESDSEAYQGGTCLSQRVLGDCKGGSRPVAVLTLRVKSHPSPSTSAKPQLPESCRRQARAWDSGPAVWPCRSQWPAAGCAVSLVLRKVLFGFKC